MVKLCVPEVPPKYWVNCLTYRCESCRNVFEILFPNRDDLVKLREINGNEEKWLPIYGKGGYLDLMTKLIPGHSQNDELTMLKSKLFLKELERYSEKGKLGNGFEINYRRNECPNCKSKNINIVSEQILENPELSWLKISCDLIK